MTVQSLSFRLLTAHSPAPIRVYPPLAQPGSEVTVTYHCPYQERTNEALSCYVIIVSYFCRKPIGAWKFGVRTVTI
jgi:hypothetical protein